ncbi:MAG: PAS domain-containing protein [Thermoplasmata archaeon]|nr:MAG: PAS domain-containing protein [Thermoplasmata archaeon]
MGIYEYQELMLDIHPDKPDNNKFNKINFSHLNTLVNNLNEGIFILKDWEIQWCNPYSEQLFHRRKSDIVGSSFKALFKSQDEFQALKREFQEKNKVAPPQNVVLEFQRSGGERFKVELMLTYIISEGERTDEFIAVIHDISEVASAVDDSVTGAEKEPEAHPEYYINKNLLENLNTNFKVVKNELAALDEKYMNLVNRTRDGVVIIQDHMIKYTNPRFAEMLGYSSNELEGRGFIDLIPTKSLESFNSGPQKQKAEEYQKIGNISESELLTKNSMSLPVEIDTCSIDFDGKAADMVIVRDISEQRLLEAELMKKNQDLQLWNQRLIETTKLKSEFLANISNELETPISSMISLSESLVNGIDGPLTLNQQENLSRVVESGYYLLNLISDLMDWARIQSGKMVLKPKMFDLRDLVADVIQTVMPQADQKGLNLEYARPDNFPEVYGDPEKIQQVIVNLLSNAIKYTPGGSIGIIFENAPEENEVKVMVWDTGIGVADENKKNIFDEFRPKDSKGTGEFHGTGLGLAISRYILELLGGTIWVEDNVTSGSKFFFTIPTVKTSSKI